MITSFLLRIFFQSPSIDVLLFTKLIADILLKHCFQRIYALQPIARMSVPLKITCMQNYLRKCCSHIWAGFFWISVTSISCYNGPTLLRQIIAEMSRISMPLGKRLLRFVSTVVTCNHSNTELAEIGMHIHSCFICRPCSFHFVNRISMF